MIWIARLRALFRKDKLTREFDEELAFHLSMREQWNVEQGMPRAEAHRDARRRFGNPFVWRERMSEIDLMTLPAPCLPDCSSASPSPSERLVCSAESSTASTS